MISSSIGYTPTRKIKATIRLTGLPLTKLPPSRGRDAFKIEADGTFTHYKIGAADGSDAITAKWEMKDKSTMVITPADGKGTTMELGIFGSTKGSVEDQEVT